jgi:hypothetical protein
MVTCEGSNGFINALPGLSVEVFCGGEVGDIGEVGEPILPAITLNGGEVSPSSKSARARCFTAK